MKSKQGKKMKVDQIGRLDRVFKPLGIILALVSGAGIYWKTSSFWLAFFGFLMVSRFVYGCVTKIILHKRRLYHTLFYLIWPVGGTIILYLVYQMWHIMWLSVILGIIGGVILSMLLGLLFFYDVVREDARQEKETADFLVKEVLEQNKDAVAMKQYFTSSEWEEIKQIPWMIFSVVARLKGGTFSKKELEVWLDTTLKAGECDDPLLRMILIEVNSDLIKSLGQMTSLSQLTSSFSQKELERHFENLASKGKLKVESQGIGFTKPEAMFTLKANLSTGEYRSFIRGLVQLGVKTAWAGSDPTSEQINAIMTFVPAENRQDLDAMLGIEKK